MYSHPGGGGLKPMKMYIFFFFFFEQKNLGKTRIPAVEGLRGLAQIFHLNGFGKWQESWLIEKVQQKPTGQQSNTKPLGPVFWIAHVKE